MNNNHLEIRLPIMLRLQVFINRFNRVEQYEWFAGIKFAEKLPILFGYAGFTAKNPTSRQQGMQDFRKHWKHFIRPMIWDAPVRGKGVDTGEPGDDCVLSHYRVIPELSDAVKPWVHDDIGYDPRPGKNVTVNVFIKRYDVHTVYDLEKLVVFLTRELERSGVAGKVFVSEPTGSSSFDLWISVDSFDERLAIAAIKKLNTI